MDYKKIGQNIQNARKTRNLTQEELAEKVNSSAGYISNIETAYKKISLPKLIDIANALNSNLDTLLIHEYKNHEVKDKVLVNQLESMIEGFNEQQKEEFFIFAKQIIQAIKDIYALDNLK